MEGEALSCPVGIANRPLPAGDYGQPLPFSWQTERLPYNLHMQRSDGRAPNQLRPLAFELDIAPHATGSVLVSTGNTRVICAAMIEEIIQRLVIDNNVRGGRLYAGFYMVV